MGPHREEATRSRVAGLALSQNRRGYRFSLDPFLLAAFARPRPREHIVDLGAGVAVISLLIARRWPTVAVVALELQQELARLARENIRAHGLESRCALIEGDLRQVRSLLPAGRFHRVLANPPFRARASGRIPADPERAAARLELNATLEDFVRAAAYLLRPGGSLDLIHLTERLPETFGLLGAHGLEAKTLRPVSSFPGGPPKLALISARRGARPGLEVLPTLAIWERPGRYSEEAAAALAPPREEPPARRGRERKRCAGGPFVLYSPRGD